MVVGGAYGDRAAEYLEEIAFTLQILRQHPQGFRQNLIWPAGEPAPTSISLRFLTVDYKYKKAAAIFIPVQDGSCSGFVFA